MGKRNSVVVLSSDDEDECSFSSNKSYGKSKSRPLITRTNPKESKKPRLLGSRSRLDRESRNVDDIGFPYEDFGGFFYTSKVSAKANWKETDNSVSKRNALRELWVHKYRPCSLEELVVRKKKIDEVKVWFEKRLTSSKEKVTRLQDELMGIQWFLRDTDRRQEQDDHVCNWVSEKLIS